MAKAEKDTNIAPEVKKTKFAAKSIVDSVLTIAFGDGQSARIDLNDVPQELHQALALHGLSQMIGDTYAGAKGDFKKAFDSASAKINQILNGDLRAPSQGGESTPRVGELASALAAVKGVDVNVALEALGKMTDEQKKQVRSHPKVKAEIAKLRAEKAAAAAAKAEEKAGGEGGESIAELPEF